MLCCERAADRFVVRLSSEILGFAQDDSALLTDDIVRDGAQRAAPLIFCADMSDRNRGD